MDTLGKGFVAVAVSGILCGSSAVRLAITDADFSPAEMIRVRMAQAAKTEKTTVGKAKQNPAMIVLQNLGAPEDPGDVERLKKENKLIFFHSDDDASSYMVHSVLGNIGATEVVEVDVSGSGSLPSRMRRQLASRGVFCGKLL